MLKPAFGRCRRKVAREVSALVVARFSLLATAEKEGGSARGEESQGGGRERRFDGRQSALPLSLAYSLSLLTVKALPLPLSLLLLLLLHDDDGLNGKERPLVCVNYHSARALQRFCDVASLWRWCWYKASAL